MTAHSTVRVIALGIAAATAVAVVYGILSEPLELTLGLLAVAFGGGWLIGNAVAFGAWRGVAHESNPALRWTAVMLAVVAWSTALVIAFALSQAFVPDASTSLASRLTVSGFFDYIFGLELVPFVDVLALALMTVMAWRGAR